jgi:hypothetical protein
LKTFQSRGINPPEFEVSSIYVANDNENLYFRFDTRSKPTKTFNAGKLWRGFSVFLDTDNKNNTGYVGYGGYGGGAELLVDVYFYTDASEYTLVRYYKYAGTGSDSSWKEIERSSNSSDFNNVFEFKIPLIGIETGRTVGLSIPSYVWSFRSQTSILSYPPDTTPPVTSIALGKPIYQIGSTTYISSSTTFNLSANDTSGVREIKYRVDNGPWATYSSGFTLSTFPDGEHTISYYSVDNTGNNETEKTLTIIMDKSPPTISEASPTGTVGSTSVTFSVKVEDSGSGVKEVNLIVDGISQGTMSASGNTYSKTLSLSKGSHTWTVEAVDNVGNNATQNYSFMTYPSMGLLPYLIVVAIIIVIIIATAAIMLRRRRAPLPPPPPP